MILFGLVSMLSAQNPNAEAIRNALPYCPGLFNPQRFTITGANQSYASWTAHGGSKVTGESTVGNWAATYTNTATASQLDNYSLTWIDECGWSNTPGTETANNFYKHRFAIINAGYDDLTGNHLYKVPTDPDTTFIRSIRLGNRCGDAQADKLVYQFKVLPQNALLVLYYAMSLENCTTDETTNPEFQIEVQVGTSTPSTQLTNLNTYTYTPVGNQMFYHQATPLGNTSDVSPFYFGSNGQHTTTGGVYSQNIYLNWKKVVINLGPYLGKPVRICVGGTDCIFSVHYTYCYFAGYCRPTSITSDGCPIGSQAITTLYAPSGVEDATYTTDPNYHAYQWYRATTDTIDSEHIGMSYADSNDWFDANFVPISGSTQNFLEVMPSDLLIDGNNVDSRTFACVMTTYMNLDAENDVRLYPIQSKMFATAQNRKPVALADLTPHCDGTVTVTNRSYSNQENYMVDSMTVWELYDNPMGIGTPLASDTAKDWTIPAVRSNDLYLKMTVPTTDEGCYSQATIPVTQLSLPQAQISADNTVPCDGEMVTLNDISTGVDPDNHVRWWRLNDSTETDINPVTGSFIGLNDTVWLHVENSLSDENGPCASDTFIVIHSFSAPEIDVIGDTILCEGNTLNLEAQITADHTGSTFDYEWYDRINGTMISAGETITMPFAQWSNSTRYYIKATRQPQGCTAWDSVDLQIVRPAMTMLPADGKICPGDTALLIARQADHYMWSANRDDESLLGQELEDTIRVSPTATTTYTLRGYGANGCEADAIVKTVTYHPTPTPTIWSKAESVDMECPVVTLKDLSTNGASQLWEFSDGEQAAGRELSHRYERVDGDSVWVRLTSYNDAGKRSETCYADTILWLQVKRFDIWLPNVITPMQENNNRFSLITANELDDFHIWIYDRRGELKYESEDYRFEWDGTSNGIKCPQGAYVYTLKYHKPDDNAIKTITGTVTLVY